MPAKKISMDEKYMKEAIRQAKKAAALKEVPIGCVIVYEGRIIGRGYNRRTIDGNVLAHAEILAIRKACRFMGDWRLEGVRAVRDAGAVPHVRRGDCPGPDSEGCDRVHESQSGLRRIGSGSAP